MSTKKVGEEVPDLSQIKFNPKEEEDQDSWTVLNHPSTKGGKGRQGEFKIGQYQDHPITLISLEDQYFKASPDLLLGKGQVKGRGRGKKAEEKPIQMKSFLLFPLVPSESHASPPWHSFVQLHDQRLRRSRSEMLRFDRQGFFLDKERRWSTEDPGFRELFGFRATSIQLGEKLRRQLQELPEIPKGKGGYPFALLLRRYYLLPVPTNLQANSNLLGATAKAGEPREGIPEFLRDWNDKPLVFSEDHGEQQPKGSGIALNGSKLQENQPQIASEAKLKRVERELVKEEEPSLKEIEGPGGSQQRLPEGPAKKSKSTPAKPSTPSSAPKKRKRNPRKFG